MTGYVSNVKTIHIYQVSQVTTLSAKAVGLWFASYKLIAFHILFQFTVSTLRVVSVLNN